MVLNQFRAIERKTVGEINKEPSLTVPNQSLSVRDILQRYTMGAMIPEVSHSVYYDGEEDFDAVDPRLDRDFDLSDISRLMADNQEYIESTLDAQKTAQSAQKAETEGEAQRSGADPDIQP